MANIAIFQEVIRSAPATITVHADERSETVGIDVWDGEDLAIAWLYPEALDKLIDALTRAKQARKQ